MQFERFHWLSHHGIYEPLYSAMIYKNGERVHDFLGLFISYCSLVFYIFGRF